MTNLEKWKQTKIKEIEEMTVEEAMKIISDCIGTPCEECFANGHCKGNFRAFLESEVD